MTMTDLSKDMSEEDKELNLLRQESYYIFENNLSMIMIIDPENGRIVEANKSAVAFYKYPKKDLLNKTIYDINILPKEEISEKMNQVNENKRSLFVFNHKLANDSIKTVRVHSSKIIIANKAFMFSVIYNDDDDIQLEKEHLIINKQLKDALIFSQNIIQNASEGIIVYDKKLRYSLWNNFMTKATGLQASQVLGKFTSEIFTEETYAEVVDGLKRALKGETIAINSVKFTNPKTNISGFTREVYSPNYDSDGNIIGVVCIVSDITSIVKYQKSLAKKNKELNELNQVLSDKMNELALSKEKAEESDHLKSTFLAHVSHEIRTPLNSIVGFSSLLKDIEDPAQISKYINIIQTNNLFLLNIIDDILTYSLLETDSIPLNLGEVNISDFLKGLFNHFKQVTTDKISLNFIPKDISSLTIYTDENKLNQIVSNLLTNAFKFTNEGTIEFGIDSYDTDKIILFVKDPGIGIDSEYHQMIFSSFHKLDSLKPGTGLGLSICKVLCEKINGKISLNSKINEGSTFYIELPYRYMKQGERK